MAVLSVEDRVADRIGLEIDDTLGWLLPQVPARCRREVTQRVAQSALDEIHRTGRDIPNLPGFLRLQFYNSRHLWEPKLSLWSRLCRWVQGTAGAS